MKTKLMIFLPLLILTSCTTRYIEKVSTPLSQAVWGAKDSADAARYDLSVKYIDEATKLVPPPSEDKRHKISSIYEN